MTTYGDLHVIVSKSRLKNGTVVYSASLKEMPGVVAEGASNQAAVSELMGMLKDLSERLPFPVFGVRTAAVESWSWTMQSSGEQARSYGPGEAALPAT